MACSRPVFSRPQLIEGAGLTMSALSQEEIREIAKQGAREALKEFLLTLGVDADDPESIFKMQKDIAHLRGWRESIELVKAKGLSAAVWFIVTGVLGGAVWYFNNHK
jgi:hypothetical protein